MAYFDILPGRRLTSRNVNSISLEMNESKMINSFKSYVGFDDHDPQVRKLFSVCCFV